MSKVIVFITIKRAFDFAFAYNQKDNVMVEQNYFDISIKQSLQPFWTFWNKKPRKNLNQYLCRKAIVCGKL